MRIGVPKESSPGERRVAATPKTVDEIESVMGKKKGVPVSAA